MIKVILKQRRANNTLNGKDKEQKTWMSTFPTSTPLEVPVGENRQEIETKAFRLEKRNKYSHRWHDLIGRKS